MKFDPVAAVLLSTVVLAAYGCAAEPVPPPPPDEVFLFSRVIDHTKSPYYSVKKTAQGVIEYDTQGGSSSTLTIGIEVTFSNGMDAHPVAVIQYADGTRQTCEQTELRMTDYTFTVRDTTKSAEIPCRYGLNQDPTGATVTITDPYSD